MDSLWGLIVGLKKKLGFFSPLEFNISNHAMGGKLIEHGK